MTDKRIVTPMMAMTIRGVTAMAAILAGLRTSGHTVEGVEREREEGGRSGSERCRGGKVGRGRGMGSDRGRGEVWRGRGKS